MDPDATSTHPPSVMTTRKTRTSATKKAKTSKKAGAPSKTKAPKKAGTSRKTGTGKKATKRTGASKKAGAPKKTPSRRSTGSKKGRGGSKGGSGRGTQQRRSAPRIQDHEAVHVLDVPFHHRAEASALGARWDPVQRVHFFPESELPAGLAPFRPEPFSWEAWVESQANGRGMKTIGPKQDIRLRDHQVEAKDASLEARQAGLPGFLLADEVGLGKTISAWSSVLEMDEAKRILIISPLSVLPGWRWTVGAMGNGGKDVVMLNWERMDRVFTLSEEARAQVKSLKGLARRGSAMSFDVVIFDESHRAKNPTAARSKLAAKLEQAAGFSFWLSATAGQNPLELSYLSSLLAARTGSQARDLRDFEVWCQKQGLTVKRGSYGKWEWERSEEDLGVMRRLLFMGSPRAGIRRVPEDIADWPEINRILHPIPLEAEARELYESAWEEFRQALRNQKRRAGGSSRKEGANSLVAQLRFRQKASLLRVPGTVELIMDLLDKNRQVAVSVGFHETVEALVRELEKKKVEAAACHGKQSGSDREKERVRFQTGKARVILFTMEEGISLHQGEMNDVPRAEIIHDLRWSGIQMAQIEGRCHRDGQYAPVYWAYAEGTVEEQIARVVASRVRSMKEMVGDDTDTLKAIETELLAAA